MRTLAIVPVFSEAGKIGWVLERFEPSFVDEVCLVLDSPEGNILGEIDEASRKVQVPVTIIENPERKGIGYAIKQGYRYAFSKGFELIIVMAGNGKDDPKEIPRLTTPIVRNGFEYIQGSRFLHGGRRDKTPFLRGLFIRLFPLVWTILVGVRCTDVTNGFRAYKASILKDSRVNVWQSWLDNYQLEYYLHYKVLTLGYRFAERPVSKSYRHKRRRRYSHISPLKDWWQIVGPLLLLRLRAKN